jgi:hypothetical protein
MQINLFVCKSERNRVNKTDQLFDRFCMNGVLKKQTSVKNLVVEIERSNFIPYKYNYMYISDFERYYYIDDIICVANNRWEIHASVDVLFSFKNDIALTRAVVDKVENTNQNMYLNDGSFVTDTRRYNEIIEFTSGLNDNGSYILICAGGS